MSKVSIKGNILFKKVKNLFETSFSNSESEVAAGWDFSEISKFFLSWDFWGFLEYFRKSRDGDSRFLTSMYISIASK